ncbi:gypsy/ty3 element polyprotein [Cucumis melo var. makuwa]|uniref:Gypsy/ty3 element polyprotein n=1 Tax=Cucumis melo var. makuwa TaxID=1194695 RepID=A0A5A7TXG3_CUCMM|nr:gypsy/ty3 element polyprotein [Cucumis melo var. makuwa]
MEGWVYNFAHSRHHRFVCHSSATAAAGSLFFSDTPGSKRSLAADLPNSSFKPIQLTSSQILVFDPTMKSHLAQLRAPSIHDLSTKSLKASPSSLACAPEPLLGNPKLFSTTLSSTSITNVTLADGSKSSIIGPGTLNIVSKLVATLGRWKKMTQKLIEDCLTTSEAEIEAIKQEVQRLPLLEKNVKKMHAMLTAMYQDHQRQLGGSKLTGIRTGKRKVRTEEVVEKEMDDREMSLSMETGAGQDQIKFKKLEMPVFNGEDLDGWFYRA